MKPRIEIKIGDRPVIHLEGNFNVFTFGVIFVPNLMEPQMQLTGWDKAANRQEKVDLPALKSEEEVVAMFCDSIASRDLSIKHGKRSVLGESIAQGERMICVTKPTHISVRASRASTLQLSIDWSVHASPPTLTVGGWPQNDEMNATLVEEIVDLQKQVRFFTRF